jgi:NAD(P)-dependent dehydrogenase (short-subunit alcohol dehydrogenase family)
MLVVIVCFEISGAKVILACRDEAKGKQAVEDVKTAAKVTRNVKFMKLDLASLQSVRDFVKAFKSSEWTYFLS